MVAHGYSRSSVDKYQRMGASTGTSFVKKFSAAVVKYFSKKYIRSPGDEETKLLLNCTAYFGCSACWEQLIAQNSFGKAVLLLIIDIRHYVCKEKLPMITIVSISYQGLSVWHIHFRLPDFNNDKPVFDSSSLYKRIRTRTYPLPAEYLVDVDVQNKRYWFAPTRFLLSILFILSSIPSSIGLQSFVTPIFPCLIGKFYILWTWKNATSPLGRRVDGRVWNGLPRCCSRNSR